jgi:hypothetical protein
MDSCAEKGSWWAETKNAPPPIIAAFLVYFP